MVQPKVFRLPKFDWGKSAVDWPYPADKLHTAIVITRSIWGDLEAETLDKWSRILMMTFESHKYQHMASMAVARLKRKEDSSYIR